MTRPCAISRIVWRGVAIEVRCCADWSPSFRQTYGHPLAHLEIEAVDPARAPLPVTETGYRSLFTAPAVIEAEGGADAFVLAWLDHEAEQPQWKEREQVARQMELF